MVASVATAKAGERGAEKSWALELERGGIEVFSRPIPGSSIREVKGRVVVSASLSRLTQLIREPGYRPRWDQLCGEAYIHQKISEQEELVYFHNRLPWPIKDRDMVLKVAWAQSPETRAVTMVSEAVKGEVANHPGRVRVTEASHRWVLTPVGDGRVEVVTIIHLDPAGPLPAWLINRLSIESPYNALGNLRSLVKAKDIPPKTYGFIREPGGARL